jgi:hypothetical protein
LLNAQRRYRRGKLKRCVEFIAGKNMYFGTDYLRGRIATRHYLAEASGLPAIQLPSRNRGVTYASPDRDQ